MTLRLSHHNPPTHFAQEILEGWAERVEAGTGGKIKSKIFSQGVLHPPLDSYNAVVNGIVDVTFAADGYAAARFPLQVLVCQTMLGVPSAVTGARIRREVSEKFPAIMAEHKDAHVMWLVVNSQANAHTINPLRNMADFAGVELRVPPGVPPWAEALGVVPVSMPMGDTFLAIEKGIVDGVIVSTGALESFRLADVTDYTTVINLYFGAFSATMNWDTWNSLTPEAQEVVNEASEWASVAASEGWDEEEAMATKWAQEEAGHEFIYPEPAEIAKMYESVRTNAINPIAEEFEAKGIPGKAIVEEVYRLIDKYSE
jgi:TRAP-type C4-dicarboxylate transport system substrate-binding protein